MDPEIQAEESTESRFCPECGSEESGYFCRTCGALLRGDDMVLCPRCHHVVPHGEFCNLCGQTLGGIALNLRQLAMAGCDFWLVTPGSAPPAPGGADEGVLVQDESVLIDKANLPDWLKELSVEAPPPEVQVPHTYPSLEPIAEHQGRRGRVSVVVLLLLALLLLGLVAGAGYLLMRGM